MSLRQGTGAVDMPHMLMSELEEVKQEKNMLYDDLNKTKYELDQIKTDFAVCYFNSINIKIFFMDSYSFQYKRILKLKSILVQLPKKL